MGIDFLLVVNGITDGQQQTDVYKANIQMSTFSLRFKKSYAKAMAVLSVQPESADHTDRRALRSRQALMDALARLLQKNDFDNISIQEISDQADLTRATFYLHYPDKTALLQAMTTVRFSDLLERRGVTSRACAGGLEAVALGVCEYLGKVFDCQSSSNIPLERSVIPVIAEIFRERAEDLKLAPGIDPDTYATTLAWAIYGAANSWAKTPNRRPAKQMARTIRNLLNPLLQANA